MPVVEKSARAWYVYDCLREMDYDNSVYTDQQLDHLYDAAESVAAVTGDVVRKSLGRIMKAINAT